MIFSQSYFGRYFSLLIPVVCAGALGSPVSSAAERNNILFESNFEAGTIRHVDQSVDGWHVKAVDPDHAAITSSVSRESGHAVRLFIDKRIDYSSLNRNGHDIPRADLTKWPLKFDYDTDYWVGWSVYLPSDWVDDLNTNFTSTMQLKQPIGGSPILSVYVKGDSWQIINRRDDSNVSWNPDTGTKTELYRGSTRDDKGKWVDFVINFRLCESAGCNGKITIWKDGERIVNQSGPNAFKLSDKGGPYLTLDLYKSAWKLKESLVQTREIYFDSVRIGGPNSDYSSVTPDGSGRGSESEPKPLPPTLGSN